jgi:uncharacterized membrane protein YfcA
MTHRHHQTGLANPQRLVWVAVIAATAGFLTSYLRLESLSAALAFALGAALISVLVVLLWDRYRRTG